MEGQYDVCTSCGVPAVFGNSFNQVLQCHACGQVFERRTNPASRRSRDFVALGDAHARIVQLSAALGDALNIFSTGRPIHPGEPVFEVQVSRQTVDALRAVWTGEITWDAEDEVLANCD